MRDHASDQLEQRPGLCGGGGNTRVAGEFRVGFAEQAEEQGGAFRAGEMFEIGGNFECPQDLTQGGVQTAGIFTNIQPGGMQAEDLQLAEGRLELGLCDGGGHGP